jgi:hypothetical protein
MWNHNSIPPYAFTACSRTVLPLCLALNNTKFFSSFIHQGHIHFEFCSLRENLKERDHLGDPGMDGSSAFFLGGRRGTHTPKYFMNLRGESKNFKILEFPLNQLPNYYGYLCDLLSST